MKKIKKDNLESEIKSLGNRFFPKIASTIEMSYESFGIKTRVVEFNYHPDYLEFCLELALGTPIEKVVKHHKDIAMAVCSITGDVEIEAPIPGRSLFSIRLPITDQWVRVQSDYYKRLETETEKNIETKPDSQDDGPITFRQYLSVVFYFISTIFELTGLFVRRLGDLVAGRIKIS